VLEGGSFDHARAVVDLDQPLTADLAGRVASVYEDSGSFRDGVKLKRWAVNPTLRYRPNDWFTAVFSYEHLDDRRTADRGVPSFDGRPAPTIIETFFGAPDQSHAQVTADLASAVLEGRIGERLVVRNHILFGDYDKFYQNIYPGAAADQPVAGVPTRTTLSAYNNSARRKNLFNQTDLVWQPPGGRVEHTVLVGAEFGRQTTDNFRNTGFFGNATSLFVPFAAPTVAGAPASFHQSATDADNHVEARVSGAYVQDQVEFGRLQVVAGLRYDRFNLDFFNRRNGARLGRTDQAVSPRLGLVVRPIEAVSLYTSYAVSFLPSAGDQFSSLTATTETLKPERFENHELGFKWAALANLDITGAVYELVRDHTSARDPDDPGRIIQTGEERSRGVELGATGEVTSRWRIVAAYAWQNAKITEATTQSVTAGKHVPLTPAHTAALWNKVTLTPRWAAALGVIHQSDQFAAIDNSVTLPGFTRLDAAVYWTVAGGIRLQGNIENLTDRRHFPTSNGNNNIAPGAPRTVRVSLQARF
jgi:catecholate siderophore receptor